MRFADRITNEYEKNRLLVPYFWKSKDEEKDSIRNIVEGAMRDITLSYKFFIEGGIGLFPKGFKPVNAVGVKPPFKNTWIECKYKIGKAIENDCLGALVRVIPNEEFVMSILPFHTTLHGITRESAKQVTALIPINNFVYTDKHGKLIKYEISQSKYFSENRGKNREVDESWKMNNLVVAYAIFAMELLNCKNVTAEPEQFNLQMAKKFRKKHKRPMFRYHVLNIKPMVSRSSSGSPGDRKSLGVMPLHMCRGHFKTFDENPLFGKVIGTFWWSSFARGKKERGVVDKDYKMEDG